jgi:hypothetical protein
MRAEFGMEYDGKSRENRNDERHKGIAERGKRGKRNGERENYE